MLEKLKTLNLDRLDLEEAVALATIGRATSNGYAFYQVPAPQWLTNNLELLDSEINRRRQELLVARKREIEAGLTALQTREEKRSSLQAELASVNNALGTK